MYYYFESSQNASAHLKCSLCFSPKMLKKYARIILHLIITDVYKWLFCLIQSVEFLYCLIIVLLSSQSVNITVSGIPSLVNVSKLQV